MHSLYKCSHLIYAYLHQDLLKGLLKTLLKMADDTLEHVEKDEALQASKTILCRFHGKEECQIFCKDCKDFLCFECLGTLHQNMTFADYKMPRKTFEQT